MIGSQNQTYLRALRLLRVSTTAAETLLGPQVHRLVTYSADVAKVIKILFISSYALHGHSFSRLCRPNLIRVGSIIFIWFCAFAMAGLFMCNPIS